MEKRIKYTYEELLKLEKTVKNNVPSEHPDFGKICNCMCHVDTVNIYCGCFTECCGRSHKKYIDINGNFDVKRFGELIMNERLKTKGKLND